jgi:CBS domain-containing protein
MLVERILPRARERLVTIDVSARVKDAAELMSRSNVDLLVVCEGPAMTGVVTRSDVMAHVSRYLDPWLEHAIDTVMTRGVVHCHASDPLVDVWHLMQKRGFQCIPVIDGKCNPIGVVYLRDVLKSLLCDAEVEDQLLRDYISGTGYR